MISKNSFWVSLKENNKRRLWVWILSALAFMLMLPAVVALALNGIERSSQWITENYENTIARQIIHEKLVDGMCRILGVNNQGLAFLAAAIALVSAVQGFSYLYSRKKIDFYMGMPVKRKKRFFVIWLNGILLYLLPYLAGLVISMLIAAGNGAMDRTVLQSAVAALLVNGSFYLGVYHMAILAVMLTGNIVVTGFAFLTFCLYEYLIRIVIEGYKEIFFQYFSYFGSDTTPLFSPFGMYYRLTETLYYANRGGKYLMGMLLFAAVAGLVSYLCYLKRPAEAAGKAMTFVCTRLPVKILLVIPAALLMGGIISDAVSFNPEKSMDGIGWMIFSMAVTVIIGSALIQVIYEFDIKGCLHKKTHIVISGILVALVFIAFRYDLFGYDSYIPDKNQIKSIAFIPDYYEEGYGRAYFDSDGAYISCQKYADKYMYLTNIEEICDMASWSMQEYENDTSDNEGRWSYATIVYRLKSGREVIRCLWVNVENAQTVKALDHIIGSEEFKKGFMMGASDILNAMLNDKDGRYRIRASYGNLIYELQMSTSQAKEFLEIYRKDMALANFSRIREHAPVGVMNINISEEIAGSYYMSRSGGISRNIRGWDVSMYVYPFYEDCITYLKEQGCYMEEQVKLEDIAKIQVVNYNKEASSRLMEQQRTAAGAAALAEDSPAAQLALGAGGGFDDKIDTRVYVDYTKEEELKELTEYLYASDLIVDDWDNGTRLDPDYGVIVYFHADSDMTKTYGTNAMYGFLEGQIPDFVKEDTVYKE